MEPLALLTLFAGIWVLSHFWIVPLLQSGWQTKNLRQKIAQAGLLAATEKLRNASGTAVLALTLVIFLTWLCSLFATIDQSLGQTVIIGLTSLYQTVSKFAHSWATFMAWAGIIGSAFALYIVARKARSQVAAVWTERAKQVFKRLSEDPTQIAEHSDDPELSEFVDRSAVLITLLEEMDQSDKHLTKRKQVELELSQLFSFCAMEIARKELEIEEVLTVQETEDLENQPNLVVRMLTSKQFTADLKLVSRPLSMLVTILLVISLIGWTSEPLANSMQLAVNNLRVHALKVNLERELLTAVETADVRENEQIEDDFAGLDSAQRVARVSKQIARISLQQMMRSGVLERSAGVQIVGQSQSEFIRAAILQKQIKSQTNSVDRMLATASETVGAQFREPEAILRQIELELSPKLEDLERRDPRLLSQLRQRMTQRYGAVTMGALDVQENLIARIVGQSFSPIAGGLDNELARQGAKISKEIGEKAVSKWANTYAYGLVTESLFGQARGEVIANLNAFRFELTAESGNLIRQVSSSSGRAWGPSATEAADQTVARRVAQNIAEYYPVNERTALVRNLSGYAEIFPTVAQMGGDGITNAVGQRASRRSVSTDFRLASRSFRVRGVLIGRDLEADELNITDLRWELQDDGEIAMRVENTGNVHELGVFDAGILNQALRYAADQRVVATTIMPGDGSIVGRITYLHPVLTDTPLGCRIIEADRFVDTFTYTQVDQRLQDIADHRRAIARWRVLARIAETIANYQVSWTADTIQVIAGSGVDMPVELASRIRKFMSNELSGEASSALLDGSLVCAEGDSENVGQCLYSKFKGISLAERYWFPEDHTSQFREREQRLDAEFEFIKLSDNRLGHVDLWLHTTFSARERSDAVADESTAKALDFSSDQLRRVNTILKEEMIPMYLQEELNMSVDEFLVPLEQFIVLQRFMRAAFNGQFGDSFPLWRLIDLQRETRQFVEYQPTIRWEPGERDQDLFIEVLRKAGDNAFSQFVNHYEDDLHRKKNSLPKCGPASIQVK